MNVFRVEVNHHVATISLNRPPANALAQDVLKELSSLLNELETNEEVRVLLLKGEGRFFSAGADIKEFTTIDTKKGFEKLAQHGQQIFDRIEKFPKPIIAAIHGAALGGGLELAMSCHIRYAAENAKLGLPELQLGIIPGFGGTQRLARLTGVAKATEMMLTSEPISGKDAVHIGLVNQAFPEEQLFEEANKLAQKIAAKSPLGTKAIIQLSQFSKSECFDQGIKEEAQLFGTLFVSEDAKEGVHAFLEKRTPVFKGR